MRKRIAFLLVGVLSVSLAPAGASAQEVRQLLECRITASTGVLHPGGGQTAGGTTATWNPPPGTCIGIAEGTLIVKTTPVGPGLTALNHETGVPPMSTFSGLAYTPDEPGEECFVGTAELVYGGFVVASASDRACG